MNGEKTLLAAVDSPADLRKLSLPELERLAAELRQYILEVVSQRGGHLGSTLGAIELTIALHKVFRTPQDKLVWDVGHQAYAHKILTGRREAFRTLRTFKGIAGFLKRSESEYDCFGAGHASTSISAAVGFALARDRLKTKERVVAIIGDGSLTGGLAFEGLNHAGALASDLLVILNDNVMSIAETGGALSTYLNRLITAPLYHRLRLDLDGLLGKLSEQELLDRRYPGVKKLGRQILAQAQKVKEGLKNMILPSSLFEELGFTYYGPNPGHDLGQLIALLEQLRGLKGPILLHLVTHKGKGFSWTENHPEKMHGARPGFDPATGEFAEADAGAVGPTWTEVFADELTAVAGENDRVVAVTAAMPSGTGLDRFGKRFPERMFDVGIAEGHAVTAAAGMAAGGLRPVVAVYSTFLQRAFDMVLHDVCLQKLPVVLALDRAGIVGEDGETHQGVFDLAFLRLIPNLVIMAPRDAATLKAMLRFALAGDSPAAIRYPRGCTPPVKSRRMKNALALGRAEQLREGGDLVIFTVGPLAYEALEVAERVARDTQRGIAVVDLRFVKPLDHDLVRRLAGETGRVIVCEEGCLTGGAGAAVLESLAEAGIQAATRLFGVPDRFIEHGRVAEVRAALGLTPPDLERLARNLLAG